MTIAPALVSKYKNDVFVETGTWHGDTVALAIFAGIKDIFSIELSEELYLSNVQKFKNHPNVHLFCGDSGNALYDIIKDVNTNITFWLDGHYSGGNTAGEVGQWPVLKELEQIKKHPLKNHIILIDDIRLFGKVCPITVDTIKYKILEINKDYTFTYENGAYPNDILVARSY